MPIQFQCVLCQKTIQTPDGSAGKDCRCPQCGEVMKVPEGPDESTPSESPFSYSVPPASPPQPHQMNSGQPGGQPESPFGPGPALGVNPYAAPPQSQGGSPGVKHIRTGRPHRASTVLTFGIISLVAGLLTFCCCYIGLPLGVGFGIPAWVMGRQDLKEMAKNRMDPLGKSNTQTGMILGIVGLSIACLTLLLFILVFALQIGMAGFGPGF